MAATGAEMEVVVVAQVGAYIKAMQEANAANLAASKGLTELLSGFKQLPGATKPAETAVGGLEKSFKDFKKEQVQEGRLFGFYAREIGSFVGLSSEASGALGGMAQGLVGLASATGPVLALWAAFEIGSAAFGYITGKIKETEEEAKKAVDAMAKLIDKATDLERKRTGVTGSDVEFGKLGAAQRIVAARDAAQAALNVNSGEINDDAARRLNALNKEIAAWEKINGPINSYIVAQKRLAEEMQAAEGVQFGPGTQKGVDTFVADSGKAAAEAQKVREEAERTANAWLTVFGPGNDAGLYVFEQARKITEDLAAGVQAQNIREAASYDAGTFDLSGVSASEVNSKRMAKDVAEQTKLTQALEQAWQDVGNAMSGAFNALGSAIGGAAGKFLSTIGEMISQAIKFAIAMAAASVAQTPVIGGLMAAAAAIGLATSLITTIASVPSYDVGTSYVPRTGLAMIHKGEAIVTAEDNARGAGRGTTVNVALSVSSWDGKDAYRAMTGARSELARVMREAVRDGVM